MTLMKATSFATAVCSLLALNVGEAAAQAQYQPFLTVTANGSTVIIQWTPIVEALGYNIQVGTAAGASNIASLNLPAVVTRIVVKAPDGTYFLRVRAIAGSLTGPFSNEASVTVNAAGGCTPPAGPTASFTVSGPSVTINWGPVANVDAYRVEFSRTPGITELAHNVTNTTTSFTQFVGMLGTFYARVVSGNACGSAAGNEVAFTIVNIGGSGPRTPDPPPGQKLPLPSYGASVVEAVARAYPGELRNSCVEHGGNNVWLFRVVQALRQRDSRWGLNWKRGNRGDMSQDIVDYNYGPGTDEDTTNVYIMDVITGHCGGNPSWNWLDQTQATLNGGAIGRWTLQPYLRAGFPGDPRQ